MIRFNIIGTGFVDMQDPSALAFKTENQQFRFADISLGRSVEFTIPATDTNRQLLGFAEDPSEYGEMMRRSLDCQMVYDGGAIIGTLNVTEYTGNAFKCVFLMDNAEWINALQNRKLADCVSSWTKGVLWSAQSTVYSADDATLDSMTEANAIIQYENGLTQATSQWQLLPAINIKKYIDDILTNLGAPHTINVDTKYWLVSNTLNGGDTENITLAMTDDDTATVTPTSQYIEVVDGYLRSVDQVWFGWLPTGFSSTPVKMFRAKQDLRITFPTNFPIRQQVFKESRTAGGYEPLEDGYLDRYWVGKSYTGQTVEVKSGTVFFLPATKTQGLDNYGYVHTAAPFSYDFIVERSGQLQLGEIWYVRNNAPDMTVFEFLRSVALATGNELFVSAKDGIVIKQGQYGEKYYKECTNVISVDHVSRCVEPWGNEVGISQVIFDSEDYVTARLISPYIIDNDLLTDTEEHKIGFSEGAIGTDGVLIQDVESATGGGYSLKAKKPTIVARLTTAKVLQRVDMPSEDGYYDLAANSTCVKMKMRQPEYVFFALESHDVWIWRGMAYVWIDAQWSQGVLSLTLQKVSQQTSQTIT